eukprot:scaffold389586_cov41-Prasinocladus_malaysianus.AAC.2
MPLSPYIAENNVVDPAGGFVPDVVVARFCQPQVDFSNEHDLHALAPEFAAHFQRSPALPGAPKTFGPPG